MKKFLISGAIAFAMVAASFNTASAQTTAELLALIASLQAQLTALQGGSSTSTSGYTHTVTLKQGSSGSQVMALQACIGATADGAFGPMTKSAVMSFQASHGLTADGVVGPMTGAAVSSACASTTTTTTTTTTGGEWTNGDGEGQLTSFEEDAPDETQVDEGDDDKVILNVSFEADDADQLITRVDLDFQAADSTESDKPWDYFKDVSILFNGDVVDTMDADSSSDWDKTDATPDIYSMRFSGLELIVEDGDEAQIEVAVSVLDNVDGSDEGQSWEAAIPVNGIRAVSPNGYSETYPTAALNEDFTVAGSDTGTLQFAESEDNPDAMALSLDDTVDTNDVLLAVYNVEADNQDILIEDLSIAVDITETGTATVMSQIVQSFTLVIDGEEYAESSLTGALDGDIVFNNIDFTLDDGDDVDFEIYADFQPLDGTIVVAGDTIAIDIDASDTVAEQASGGNDGDTVTPTGDIAGEDHAYFVDAPEITHVSSTITKTLACDGACASGEKERAEAVITYKVHAVDADIYLPDELAEDADETDTTYGTGSTYYLDEHGGTEPTAVAVLTSTDAETDANGWVVRKGQTKTFKANVTITAAADGYQSVGMSSIEWALTSTAGGSATDYTYSLQPDWETDLIYLEMTA